MGFLLQMSCGGSGGGLKSASFLLSCCYYFFLVAGASKLQEELLVIPRAGFIEHDLEEQQQRQQQLSENARHAVVGRSVVGGSIHWDGGGGGSHMSGTGGERRVKRIIGGERVDIKTVPYMLSLRLNRQHVCGAVIIGNEWSLTAAHCCIAPTNLTLQSGTETLAEGDGGEGGGKSHRVTRVVRHELYREDDDDYDLCALRVEPGFVYSDVTAPAKLPTLAAAAAAAAEQRASPSSHLTAGGSVCGWGYTEAGGTILSSNLQLMNVSRVDLEDCKYAYRYLYTIHDDDVCYGSANGSKDACQGDSGGPLINQDSAELVGIVSFGDECGYSKLPGVYVDVLQFREWIQKTTGL